MSTPPVAQDDASLAIEFQPVDRSVHHVRLMVLSFVQLAVNDHAFASRVTVCCAELAETLGRKLGGRTCTLRVRLSPTRQKVRVEVSGEGREGELRALENAIGRTLPGAPIEAYTRALTSTGPDSEVLLSLARVRYEAQLQLSSRKDGPRLIVSAETP